MGIEQAGLVELISSNGFLVKSGDVEEMIEKIEKILYDQNLAKKMSQESLKLIQDYSIQKTTNKLLHVYQNLISKTTS